MVRIGSCFATSNFYGTMFDPCHSIDYLFVIIDTLGSGVEPGNLPWGGHHVKRKISQGPLFKKKKILVGPM